MKRLEPDRITSHEQRTYIFRLYRSIPETCKFTTWDALGSIALVTFVTIPQSAFR